MRSLDFSSVVMISAFLILVLIVLAVVARKSIARGGGFVFCVAGLVLTFAGSLNESFTYATQREQIFWACVGIVLAVLGIALVMCCYRVTLGMGARVAWNLAIAAAHAVAIMASFFFFFDYWGTKTICFSTASLCLAVPVLWKNRRDGVRNPLAMQLEWTLGIFCAGSMLRLVFASLDLRRDLFISDELDAWLYLLIEISAIFSFIAFIAYMLLRRRNVGIVMTENAKERLSLASHGLTGAEIRCTLAILSGKSTKEVAADFGIKVSTVRNTLSHVYPKLGVDSLVGIFALAGRCEIVE